MRDENAARWRLAKGRRSDQSEIVKETAQFPEMDSVDKDGEHGAGGGIDE